jgi:hypothetical protein
MKTTLQLTLLLLAGCGDNIDARLAWGIGVAHLDKASFARTDLIPHLDIPTYDGSGQAVHPDILVENDHRYLLAFTPYPFTDARFENPSIAIGPDGVSFYEPSPGVNPLVPPPPKDHNNDPDLRRDPLTGQYVVMYLQTERPERQQLVELRSSDLISWDRSVVIDYDLATGAPFIVSPAVVGTALFDVRLGMPNVIERMDAPWTPSTAHPINIDMHGITPWHIDVFPLRLGHAMLISGYTDDFEHQDLYIATSDDLETWTLRTTPLLQHLDPALGDVATLYRSTGADLGSELVVWYSMQYQP